MRPSFIAACLLAAVTLTAHAQEDIPPFDTYVSDPAGVLGPELIPTMEMMFMQVAESGGARIAVLSVADLQGEPAGQYALRALYEWKAGDGGTRSSLFLLAPDGVVALATGGELLPRMSRAEAEATLVETLLPTAAQVDLTTALLNAAQSVMVSLMSEEGGPTGDPFAVVAHFGPDGSPELMVEDDEFDPSTAAATDSPEFNLDPELWINEMTTALSFALRTAVDDPAAFLARAHGEAQALPAVLDMASSQPTVPEQVVVRLILLGASLVLCVFAWRVTHSSMVLLGVIGVLGGLWLWQLSGFAELALCVMLFGVLFLPLLRLMRLLLTRAARKEQDERGNTTGPSQSYQEWLAAQQPRSGQAPRKAVSAAVPKPKTSVSATAPAPAPQPGSDRLPGGLIDNRSIPSKGAAAGVGTKLAGDRERLHKAGVATPGIDQLLRSRAVLDGLNKRKLQMIAIGGFIAIAVFGPIAAFALIIVAVLWGRTLWVKVKPANLSTGEFLKQVAKEAEAASKLPRN
ncbi:MAG: TPM domain-containing protein [Pseudomonadota bacterium]|nr:TPM domain-containing protein [Pseudomonadota bacterium]